MGKSIDKWREQEEQRPQSRCVCGVFTEEQSETGKEK